MTHDIQNLINQLDEIRKAYRAGCTAPISKLSTLAALTQGLAEAVKFQQETIITLNRKIKALERIHEEFQKAGWGQ